MCNIGILLQISHLAENQSQVHRGIMKSTEGLHELLPSCRRQAIASDRFFHKAEPSHSMVGRKHQSYSSRKRLLERNEFKLCI